MNGRRLLCGVVLLAAGSCSDGDGGLPPPDGGRLDAPRADGAGAPGRVVITELMPDPQAVADTAGEWLELHNPGAGAVDLSGWVLRDLGADQHVISAGQPLLIAAGGYLAIARNADPARNGGVPAAYGYSDFNLSNSADEVVLLDAAGVEVDRVVYSSTWNIAAGVAHALREPGLDNADAANWCPSKDPWPGSAGDRGSPGAPNTCGAPNPQPDAGPPGGCAHAPTRSISFNESLCPGVADGSKTITIRNKHWTWVQVGQWVKLVCSSSKTTFEGQLTVVRQTTYGGITAEEYTADGFQSQSEMLQVLQQFYPGITLDSPATVIRWDQTTPCS